MQFGTGSIEGFISSDTFSLGSVTIKGQNFGEIVAENGRVFEATSFSGILGLAFPAMAAYDYTPVFDNILGQVILCIYIYIYIYMCVCIYVWSTCFVYYDVVYCMTVRGCWLHRLFLSTSLTFPFNEVYF